MSVMEVFALNKKRNISKNRDSIRIQTHKLFYFESKAIEYTFKVDSLDHYLRFFVIYFLRYPSRFGQLKTKIPFNFSFILPINC